MKCEICGTENPALNWTDTHGVAQCCTCGTPYKILHYDDDGNRVDREPEIMIIQHWVPMTREYWETHKRMIPSGYSFTGNPQYELASSADTKAFYEWCDENRHRVATFADPDESTH